jgi:hypothetical protein
VRYVDTAAARPRWRINVAAGVSERLLIGVEANPAVGEITPTANYVAQSETAARPMVNVGTSSDRIFSPRGYQSVYATAAKTISRTRLSPYVSLSWSGWERRLLFPLGVNYALDPHWDAMIQHDGRNTHWLLTHKWDLASASAILVKGRYYGFSFGTRF